MAGKSSRTFYCIMEPNIWVLISTKGLLSHSIVYIHVRAPEYISVITFLFKITFELLTGFLANIFPYFIMIVPVLQELLTFPWNLLCVGGITLWLTVLVWCRMCFSTQHNIFLKWMCTYNWCCLILTKNSTYKYIHECLLVIT
jgi:hypothetical protein